MAPRPCASPARNHEEPPGAGHPFRRRPQCPRPHARRFTSVYLVGLHASGIGQTLQALGGVICRSVFLFGLGGGMGFLCEVYLIASYRESLSLGGSMRIVKMLLYRHPVVQYA